MTTSAAAMPASETHRIRLAEGSRLVASSDGLGWANVHASVTSERRWEGSLTPIDHICFAYCLRRSARIERRLAGESAINAFALHPRQLGILPTHVASSFRVTGSADMILIYLRGSLVARLARELFERKDYHGSIQPLVGFCDPLLEQIAMEIAAALDRRNAREDPPYIDQLATAAASHLIRHKAERPEAVQSNGAAIRSKPAHQAILARLQHYIITNLDEDLSLSSLAREAELTPGRVTALFSAAKGETPYQYIIKLRVERAMQLLIGTQNPISEIALQTGFSSQSHLSDVFKRVTGETPAAFRKVGDSADRVGAVAANLMY